MGVHRAKPTTGPDFLKVDGSDFIIADNSANVPVSLSAQFALIRPLRLGL